MKTISIVVPTYNEQDNINLVYDRVVKVMSKNLPAYTCELIFIDNYSTDQTREFIRALCKKDDRVKAIFNARNFGFSRSTYYGLLQAKGDCAILMAADMQDPPEVIPQFVDQWEKGAKIVVGVKNKSRESPIMYLIRKFYYFLVDKISEIDHIAQYDGFGLYDRKFLDVLAKLDDPRPYLRGIVAELGFHLTRVNYTQDKRKRGKSSFSFIKLYDVAMEGITSYSKMLMRIATFIGCTLAIISLIIAIITFILKLLYWDTFPIGMAAASVGVFFLSAIQLFFIGILGEYVLSINTRVLKRPLVIEEDRINFDANEEKESVQKNRHEEESAV